MVGRTVTAEIPGLDNQEGTISHFDKASSTAIVVFPSGDSTTMTIKRVQRGWCRNLLGSYLVKKEED